MNKNKILLGKRIKELREKRRLTQDQLSEKVGMAQKNLSKIECGRTFPSRNLVEIANALDVSLPDLFNFDHIEMTPDNMCEYIKITIDKLSPEQIKIIYSLINILYK